MSARSITLVASALLASATAGACIDRSEPASEARTIHVVTAHGADRVPAVRVTLDAIERLVADGTAPGGQAGRN